MTLTPQPLQWNPTREDGWHGTPEGTRSLWVTLVPAGTNGHYMILPSFQVSVVAQSPGLEAAQEQAQHLFDDFVRSLLVPFPTPLCLPTTQRPPAADSPFFIRAKNQYPTEGAALQAVMDKTGFKTQHLQPCHTTYHWRWQHTDHPNSETLS